MEILITWVYRKDVHRDKYGNGVGWAGIPGAQRDPIGGDPWEGGNPWEPKGIPWEGVPDPPREGNPWEPKASHGRGPLGSLSGAHLKVFCVEVTFKK